MKVLALTVDDVLVRFKKHFWLKMPTVETVSILMFSLNSNQTLNCSLGANVYNIIAVRVWFNWFSNNNLYKRTELYLFVCYIYIKTFKAHVPRTDTAFPLDLRTTTEILSNNYQ